MRAVIVENTCENMLQLKKCIQNIIPGIVVKGFINGDDAEKWCNDHTSDVDIYFGNWWSTNEDYDSPEGSIVWKYVNWQKRPSIICVGDESQFESWSLKEGADSFIERPINVEKLREVFQRLHIC